MKIREATTGDIIKIVDFQLNMAFETENITLNRDIVSKGVAAVFADKSLGRYYVAEADDQVVASLLITYEWSDWRNTLILWIQSVYVSSDFRRKGVFSNMYSHIKQIVETSAKYCGIRLYVDMSNLIAQEVYNKLGMNGNHYKTFEWFK